MKKIFLSWILTWTVSGALVTGAVVVPRSNATIQTEKVLEVFAEEYLKEQVKFQLAQFINQNPHFVFSTNPNIGTESLRFVSRVMAAIYFMTAETDKDRGWAAIYLVVTPEPTTAAILLAVQLGDALISLQHQKELMRIYEETTRIQVETSRILTQVYLEDFSRQTEVINQITNLIDQVILSVGKIENMTLVEGRQEPASEEDFFEALSELIKLRQTIFDLEVAKILFDAKVDSKGLGLDQEFVDSINRFIHNAGAIRRQVDEIYANFQKALLTAKAQDSYSGLKLRVAEHRQDLRLYLSCVKAANRLLNTSLSSGIEVSLDQERLVEDCQIHFVKLEGQHES